MDLLDFTYFIFILVVIILILFPATYLSMNGQTLNLIQQRSVWKDLRILIPCILYAVILGFRYNYAFDWEQYRYTFEFLKMVICIVRQQKRIFSFELPLNTIRF